MKPQREAACPDARCWRASRQVWPSTLGPFPFDHAPNGVLRPQARRNWAPGQASRSSRWWRRVPPMAADPLMSLGGVSGSLVFARPRSLAASGFPGRSRFGLARCVPLTAKRSAAARDDSVATWEAWHRGCVGRSERLGRVGVMRQDARNLPPSIRCQSPASQFTRTESSPAVRRSQNPASFVADRNTRSTLDRCYRVRGHSGPGFNDGLPVLSEFGPRACIVSPPFGPDAMALRRNPVTLGAHDS